VDAAARTSYLSACTPGHALPFVTPDPTVLPLRESETAARLRDFDWSSTALGPLSGWPTSLRVAVGICLNSRSPMSVLWGADLVFVYNDACIPFLGQRHPGALGRPLRDAWAGLAESVGPQLEAVMLRGEATCAQHVPLVTEPDGNVENARFTWSMSGVPDDAGGIGGVFCAWEASANGDGAGSLELELEHAARVEAERLSRMKDEFLGVLSHQLRTPLNAILGWSQLIGRGRVSGDVVAKGLAVIERSATVQAQLIDETLDMVRVAAGKVQLDVEELSLPTIINAALEIVRPAADAKGIGLSGKDHPGRFQFVGDAHRLQQMVCHLVTNAVRFTTSGGSVGVGLQHVDGMIELTVADTGRGIAPDFLPHLFEAFRQKEGGTSREHGGFGLGLAFVKQVAEAHHGTVSARSAGPGTGSTLTVRLPGLGKDIATPGTATPGLGKPRSTSEVPGPLANLTGLRVLVVDDEPEARDLLRRILGEQGVDVTVAACAAEALGLLRRHPFALLISDIRMPEQDGFDLIREVRNLPSLAGRAVPAVALTALAGPEDKARALSAGYQAHLTKPVDVAALYAVVAQLAGAKGKLAS
jgi:signal transduction histidine kinase/CheY-like chemotaxis protein